MTDASDDDDQRRQDATDAMSDWERVLLLDYLRGYAPEAYDQALKHHQERSGPRKSALAPSNLHQDGT